MLKMSSVPGKISWFEVSAQDIPRCPRESIMEYHGKTSCSMTVGLIRDDGHAAY